METAVQVNSEAKPEDAASAKESKIFEPPKGFESKFSGMALDLPIFEGPLDLLLFLIRDQKLDIMDLPIAHVTKQYMDYLFRMEEFKLEIAAEFISMAAQLVQIKSRMLLPLPPKDGEAEDPREELALRLQQYEAIKEAAKELSIREGQMQGVIFTNGLDMDEYAKTEDEPIRATAMDLLGAYRDILKCLLPPPPVEVVTPPKSLEQRIAEVLELLGADSWLPFARLFAGSKNREDLVLTFLALLEIVKNGRAKLVQTEVFGEIRVQAA
ncbi:MAG: segregation/condensation protein A [Holophagales bacterium]|jgi:segregation and condensation protein A|nr:segregation/condensation protein A [Holophagales bacterium]